MKSTRGYLTHLSAKELIVSNGVPVWSDSNQFNSFSHHSFGDRIFQSQTDSVGVATGVSFTVQTDDDSVRWQRWLYCFNLSKIAVI
jgi:hypothetical protein